MESRDTPLHNRDKNELNDNDVSTFPPPGPRTLAYQASGSESTPERSPKFGGPYHAIIASGTSANSPTSDTGNSKTPSKMDPFEVRVRFANHLMHLNASVTSANKAAQYALKYKDMDEDLHNVILEQLEQGTMNIRANIMYFIEQLCDNAAREKHSAYVRMIERDIIRVVDAVAPEDGSGAANVKVVRKVITGLGDKSFINAQTVAELEIILKEREALPDNDVTSPSGDVEMGDAYTPQKNGGKIGHQQRVDKRLAEQRIEEDRERHKRSRESIWAVPNVGLTGNKSAQEVAARDQEFERLWEETSDLGEDDFDLYAEEAEDRKNAADDWKEEYARRAGFPSE